MSKPKAAFVLVHGGWHNQTAWDRLTPFLEARGHLVLALDLPGAGANATAPRSLSKRPFDPAVFAAEPSPVANVALEERIEAVIAIVKDAAARSGGTIVLVGHSAGGMVISAVAERVPGQLAAIVYIAGFMLPNGVSLLDMLPHETMASALSVGLFVGDPVAIGATRIHPGSTDGAYRALLKASFYADACDADFDRIASGLHSDEPNGGALTPSEITRGRFGSVPRHYIRTMHDRAVPLGGQDHMIAAVDTTIGGATVTHTMETSHSPFLSQPDALAKILDDIAARPRRP